ncbi:transposase [Streptomyces scopuliridis]|uniref:transposase n=1 Tax=Streptomyces scopuliridis TaxID=452529 RepID=UPI003697C337
MKHSPAEFKADAIALCQSRPGATIAQVAVDLGVNPETLRKRVRAAGENRPRGRRAKAAAEPPTPLVASLRTSKTAELHRLGLQQTGAGRIPPELARAGTHRPLSVSRSDDFLGADDRQQVE